MIEKKVEQNLDFVQKIVKTAKQDMTKVLNDTVQMMDFFHGKTEPEEEIDGLQEQPIEFGRGIIGELSKEISEINSIIRKTLEILLGKTYGFTPKKESEIIFLKEIMEHTVVVITNLGCNLRDKSQDPIFQIKERYKYKPGYEAYDQKGVIEKCCMGAEVLRDSIEICLKILERICSERN